MGNTVSGSKDRHSEETVDFGFLSPQGVYTGTQDWNQQVVGNLIVDRKLAPFYRPLEEYDESWDDEHVLAARKELPNAQPAAPGEPPQSASTSSKFHHHKTPTKTGKEPFRPSEASVYRGAMECPICFLYYPPNINRSRCCDQAICTECFVQIKRAEPTTTHLVSEPAACPYCVQENFGVTYDPPSWRAGLMRDGQHYMTNPRPDMSKSHSPSANTESIKRRKSFGADSPEVVTIDQIRPDWEAKLAAVRAAVTRRANRRIIMRQVGDRLIPIGVTSGRVIAGDGTEGGVEGTESGGSGRRRRRNQGGHDINQLLGSVGIGGIAGQDLEELMVMEAMRLSLLEHDEQQRRQNSADNGNNINTNGHGNDNASTPPGHGSSPESSPGASPRQSLTVSGTPSRSSSLHGPSPLGDQSPRLSSGQGSTLAAALAAAQTASAFFAPQSGNGEREAPAVEGDVTPHASRSLTLEPSAAASIARATTPKVQPVSLGNSPYTVAADAGDESASPEPSSSLAIVATPPTPISAPDAEENVVPSSNVPAGYVPLPSSTEMADPLLNWENT